MEKYIAVVKSENNKITKFQDFESKSDADAHIATHGGFVADTPDGQLEYWVVDADNKTLTHDKSAEDSATIQHAFDMLREERNLKLVESDYTVLPDSALSDDDKKKWADYRKLLRDFPATLDNSSVLGDITWPTKP